MYGINLKPKVIFAVRGGNLELLKKRIEAGGNLNYQDSHYGSALVSAIGNSDAEVLMYLIKNGVEVNAENSHGIVPLEVALHHSNTSFVRLLFYAGAKLSSRSRPYWKKRLEACLSDGI